MKLSEWRLASKLPKHETDMIIEHVCGLNKLHIVLDSSKYELSDCQTRELNRIYFERYERKYPLQYIFGYAFFDDLKFKVTPDVLIPRQDTELIIQKATECIAPLAHREVNVLDLCTGSGCIAISLANRFRDFPAVNFYASDISEKALKVAKENASNLNTDIDFICSDLFDKIDRSFDVIISNPPYISLFEKCFMSEDTLKFEPEIALYGANDGLEFYIRIADNYKNFLNTGGHLLLEVGFKQAEAVADLFREISKTEIIKDISGHCRVVHVFN